MLVQFSSKPVIIKSTLKTLTTRLCKTFLCRLHVWVWTVAYYFERRRLISQENISLGKVILLTWDVTQEELGFIYSDYLVLLRQRHLGNWHTIGMCLGLRKYNYTEFWLEHYREKSTAKTEEIRLCLCVCVCARARACVRECVWLVGSSFYDAFSVTRLYSVEEWWWMGKDFVGNDRGLI
jgi:hypothetical protein